MTTRFPSGVSTADPRSTLGNYGAPDPTKFQSLFDDFNDFLTGAWTVVETQAAATQALQAGAGGQLLLTNSAAIADVNAITTAVAGVRFDAGKRFFAKARVSLSDVANEGFVFGFGNTAAALNPANGVYMSKAANGQATTINVENTSVVVSTTLSPAGSWANATFRDIGFAYDPRAGEVTGFLDGLPCGSVSTATMNTGVDMLFFYGVVNNNAVANTGVVDYLFFAVER